MPIEKKSPFVRFQSNMFSDLQNVTLVSSYDSQEQVTIRSRDIHFVLNDKALEALDPQSLRKFLEPLNNDSVSESEKLNLSDADLFDFCQSRYIQQPSDVQDYANYLKTHYDEIKTKIEKDKAYKDDLKRFVDSLRSGSEPSNKVSYSQS